MHVSVHALGPLFLIAGSGAPPATAADFVATEFAAADLAAVNTTMQAANPDLAEPIVPLQQEQQEPPEEIPPQQPPPQGEIVVEASGDNPPGDPISQINEQTYAVAAQIDQSFVEPIALAYERVLPDPVREGISNFFSNLREPVVFLNFLLQGRLGKAAETLGRFTVNSTLGLAGLIDVAAEPPFNLPQRNNGFANTLGFYGVEPGAFLYLPLIGPTTIRDALGNGLDTLLLPTAIGRPFNSPAYAVTSYTLRSLDDRIELDNRYRIIRESPSPYDLMRQIYLCERQSEIDALRGREAEDCAETFRLDEVAGDVPAVDVEAPVLPLDATAPVPAEENLSAVPEAGEAPQQRPPAE